MEHTILMVPTEQTAGQWRCIPRTMGSRENPGQPPSLTWLNTCVLLPSSTPLSLPLSLPSLYFPSCFLNLFHKSFTLHAAYLGEECCIYKVLSTGWGDKNWRQSAQGVVTVPHQSDVFYFNQVRHRDQTCGVKGERLSGGMDWEFGVSRCKLLHAGWINNRSYCLALGYPGLKHNSELKQCPELRHNGKEYF